MSIIILLLIAASSGKFDHNIVTRPTQVITIPEDYDVRFNAEHGDTINVVMYPDGNPTQRCDDMGGIITYNPYTLIWTCESVDF